MKSTELATRNEGKIEKSERRYLRPHYEITSDKAAYFVHVYMPGVVRKRTTITLHNGILVIEGIKESRVGKDWRLLHKEIPAQDYRLRLELNVPVDENKIEAHNHDGVLTLTLPVTEAAKPRAIAIE